MQCLYQTLDLLPSATDSEIRSAYRRCALSTHPDKGGSAEAFRSVVTAFETLIDRSQRAAYDQLRSRPTASTEPGGLGSVRKDLPKRPAEAAKSPRPPKVKRPTPAKDAKDAPKKPTPPRRKAPPAAAEMEMEGGPMDHAQLFRRLLRMRKKQAVEELQKLTEETLNAFAGFLQSEEVEEILRASLMLPILALQDRPKTQKCAAVSAKSMKKSNETKMQKMPKPPKAPGAAKAPKQKRFESNPARGAKTLLKGVTKKNSKSYRSSISLFRGFMAAGAEREQSGCGHRHAHKPGSDAPTYSSWFGRGQGPQRSGAWCYRCRSNRASCCGCCEFAFAFPNLLQAQVHADRSWFGHRHPRLAAGEGSQTALRRSRES